MQWLEENISLHLLELDPEAVAYAVQRSCEMKAEVVAEDEREAGRRALLNFGHTFGHAIEHCLGYGEWLHGEAVAAGMVMAAQLSGIDSDELNRLQNLLASAGLPTKPPAVGAQAMLDAMGMDKKVLQKQLRFVLLGKLGSAHVSSDVDPSLLERVLEAAN